MWIWAAAACALSFLLTLQLTRRPPGALTRPPHTAENYRGRPVVATLGVVLIAALAVSAGAATAADPSVGPAVAAATGVILAALGLLDDVKGSKVSQGFSGHLKALARGKVTTGLLKAAGGGLAALAAAAALGERGWWTAASGAAIALAANLFNLLDTRPGRCAKFWLVAAAPVAVLAAAREEWAFVVVIGLAGGVAGFLPGDLGERGMLGDTGSNLLGAVLGVVFVAVAPKPALVAVLAVLVVLNGLSEKVSFGAVIERTPGLRGLDGLGRLRPDGRVGPPP